MLMLSSFFVFLGWGLLFLSLIGLFINRISTPSYLGIVSVVSLIISLLILNVIYGFTLFGTLFIVIGALILNSILFEIFINAKYAQNPHRVSIGIILIVFTVMDVALVFNAIKSIISAFIV